jgi:hypothetical protein
MLQSDYTRGTKDSDVIETEALDKATQQALRILAGVDTPIHRRHRLYIDIVRSGFPFLPQLPKWHPLDELSESLRHFDVTVLDVVDVVVSKLKRFNQDDRSDIEAMVERELVEHGLLLERFQRAVDWFAMDARAHQLNRYARNLNEVERDILGVDETEIELPGWL